MILVTVVVVVVVEIVVVVVGGGGGVVVVVVVVGVGGADFILGLYHVIYIFFHGAARHEGRTLQAHRATHA